MVFSIIVIVLPIQGSSTLLRDVKLCVCAVLLSILALEVRHTDLRDLQLPQARATRILDVLLVFLGLIPHTRTHRRRSRFVGEV